MIFCKDCVRIRNYIDYQNYKKITVSIMLTSIKCMEELLYREMRDKKWSETGISQ